MRDKNVILELDPIDFKTRFLKSLIVPSVFLWIGIMSYISWNNPFIWIITFLYIVTFIIMNYNAMRIFITKIEFNNDCIKLEYLKFDNQLTLRLLINESTTEYYGNGIGISSLVSDHIRIGKKGNDLIRQYKNQNWTLDLMKITTDKLEEIKTTSNNGSYEKP